jgi:cell division ATPase FtsA
MRSLAIGGDAFTDAIAGEFGISFADAEKLKKEPESVLPEIEIFVKQERIRKAALSVLERMKREIMYTLRLFILKTEVNKIDRIFLTGGGWKLREIKEVLFADLHCEVMDFPGSAKVAYSANNTIAYPVVAGAVGLALPALKKTRADINFRKEELSFRQDIRKAKRALVISGILAGGIILTLLVGLYGKKLMLEHRYSALRTEMQSIIKETFPGLRMPPKDKELQEMQNKFSEVQKQYSLFRQMAIGSSYSLEVLRELASISADGLDFKVSSFEMDPATEKNPATIRLAGKIARFDLAEKLKRKLEESPLFKGVSNLDMDLSPAENVVKFKLTVFLETNNSK